MMRFLAGSAIVGGVLVIALMAASEQRDADRPAITQKAAATQEDHANTVVAAKQLNEQWAKTFDTQKRYPNDPAFHQMVLGKLILIPPDSPSFEEAQRLRETFSARQVLITRIEAAKNAVEPARVKLGQVDMSYGIMRGDFSVQNPNSFAIADVKILCTVTAASGTVVGRLDFTLYQLIPAKGSKAVKAHQFGLWPEQGKSVGCQATDYQRRG